MSARRGASGRALPDLSTLRIHDIGVQAVEQGGLAQTNSVVFDLETVELISPGTPIRDMEISVACAVKLDTASSSARGRPVVTDSLTIWVGKGESLHPLLQLFDDTDLIVAHNALGFDMEVLRKHYTSVERWFSHMSKVFDTLAMLRASGASSPLGLGPILERNGSGKQGTGLEAPAMWRDPSRHAELAMYCMGDVTGLAALVSKASIALPSGGTTQAISANRLLDAMRPFGGTAGLLQGSTEWFTARQGKLTASLAPAILGMSDFMTRQEAHDVLRGLPQPTPPPEAQARMRVGTGVEPIARALYEGATGQLAKQVGLIVHPDHPQVASSPDGLVEPWNSLSRLLEIKVGSDRVPYLSDPYLIQLIVQMACTGAPSVDFVAVHARTLRWESTNVARDLNAERVVLEQCLAAHAEAQVDDEPLPFDALKMQELRSVLRDMRAESVGPTVKHIPLFGSADAPALVRALADQIPAPPPAPPPLPPAAPPQPLAKRAEPDSARAPSPPTARARGAPPSDANTLSVSAGLFSKGGKFIAIVHSVRVRDGRLALAACLCVRVVDFVKSGWSAPSQTFVALAGSPVGLLSIADIEVELVEKASVVVAYDLLDHLKFLRNVRAPTVKFSISTVIRSNLSIFTDLGNPTPSLHEVLAANGISSNPDSFQRAEQLAESRLDRDSDAELLEIGKEALGLTLELLRWASASGLVYTDGRMVPAEQFRILGPGIEAGVPVQPPTSDDPMPDPDATVEDPPVLDSPDEAAGSQVDDPASQGGDDAAAMQEDLVPPRVDDSSGALEAADSRTSQGGGSAEVPSRDTGNNGGDGGDDDEVADDYGARGGSGGGEEAMQDDQQTPARVDDSGDAADAADDDEEFEFEQVARGEEDADQLESIVGRAATLVRRREQRWFLVKWADKPLKDAEWVPEADFDTPRRQQMLGEYKAATGVPGDPERDPEGRGWVRSVVRRLKRGRERKRTVYVVRWFVSNQSVPMKVREEYVERNQLLAPEAALGDQDEGRDPDDDDDADSDASSDSDDGDARAHLPLVWDASEGRSKVGISAAIESFDSEHSWIELALKEWCDWRLWLLQCRAPRESSVTDADMDQLGRDLYEIDRAKIDPLIVDGMDQDEHEREQIGMMLQRVARRWRRRRRQRERDTRQLRGQLLALRMVAARRRAGGQAANPSATLSSQSDDQARAALGFVDSDEPAAVRAIAAGIADDERSGRPWWRAFAQPRARMHTQTNLISGSRDAGGNRNAKQTRYLDWLRTLYSDKEKEMRLPARGSRETRYKPEWVDGDFGSPYSTFWPRRATSTNVTLEHIVCSEWLRLSESRVIEAGLPRQDATACTLANNFENSSRLDKPLGVFGEARDTANTRLYNPEEVSDQKLTRLAVATCHGILCYPFVAEESKQAGSRKIAGSFGVSEYARRIDGLKRSALRQSSEVARRIAFVNAARHAWHNALTLRPGLLRQPRYTELLEMRLRGGRSPTDPERLECGLAMLTDFVLASSVEDAPM